MCGIIGYVGSRNATEMITQGLKAMEGRGYDSLGLYVGGAGCVKVKGTFDQLAERLKEQKDFQGHIGIGHNRWATHGEASETNAHPHCDTKQEIWVVHNGQITNYARLKKELQDSGVIFVSETDTEVIPHLLRREIDGGADMATAVTRVLALLQGAFGLAVFYVNEPERLYGAALGSPLMIGIADHGHFFASSEGALASYARQKIVLNDGEMAVISSDEHQVMTFERSRVGVRIEDVDADYGEVDKAGYAHFMLKEIMEAPQVVLDSTRGRLKQDEHGHYFVKLGGLDQRHVVEKLRAIDRVVIVGCGTAYHAGLFAKSLLERYAHISVEVFESPEFTYGGYVQHPEKTALLAVSQSGETADTIAAVKKAQQMGMLTLGLINVVGSQIARLTDAGVYNAIGPEIAVASTKAMVSQLVILTMIAMFLSEQRGLHFEERQKVLGEIAKLSEVLDRQLQKTNHIQEVASSYSNISACAVIGPKWLAWETALKIREIAYIHAIGFSAPELKHGNIALIEESYPTIAITTRNQQYERTKLSIEQIKARRGPVIALTDMNDMEVGGLSNHVIAVEYGIEVLKPVLSLVQLQLFSYYLALSKDLPIDKPRNLAKSVTVE